MAFTAYTYGDPTISHAYQGVGFKGVAFSTVGASGPVPVAAALKGGTVGAAYSETIGAAAGFSPYTFAVSSGSLPTSTSLNPSTGVISGTPTVAGTYTFTITVTDNTGATGSRSFTIVIAAASSGGVSNYGFVA